MVVSNTKKSKKIMRNLDGSWIRRTVDNSIFVGNAPARQIKGQPGRTFFAYGLGQIRNYRACEDLLHTLPRRRSASWEGWEVQPLQLRVASHLSRLLRPIPLLCD